MSATTKTSDPDRQARKAEAAVERPWSLDAKEVAATLTVDPGKGLSEPEVRKRRGQYGPNRLHKHESRSRWRILVAQFRSLIVALLAVAAFLSFAFDNLLEGFAIVVVLLINGAIGFFTELRAVRSMEALRKLTRVSVAVRRAGEVRKVPADDLVPGDIVVFEGGDIVAADVRLFEASKLQADESALTGESVPVGKNTDALAEDVEVNGRHNLLFKGTTVTRGSGAGVVVATGMASELGEISSLVEEAAEELTPLEQRLDKLGRKLVWVTVAIAVATAVSGILAGKELILMIETAIALTVAAIPEGLPIVATIALARGMWRMARRNALINRLSAVETLGATTVICADKTGTLTENRMHVVRYAFAAGDLEVSTSERAFTRDGTSLDPARDPLLRAALEVGVFCSNASLSHDKDGQQTSVGDPLEAALLRAGQAADIQRDKLVEEHPEQREEAFDPEVKMMATFHTDGDGFRVAVKGAAEAVLDASTRLLTADGESDLDRERWRKRSEAMAADGLRVLALAQKQVSGTDSQPYKDLVLIGLVGLLDPPRSDVRESIERCHEAGIKVVMVTGDQPTTAVNVARAVGLLKETDKDDEVNVVLGKELKAGTDPERIRNALVFARVSPKQKLDLIASHQKTGAIVAMTGDGVNDAPALKKADIGVAMGRRGTEVAREAAEVILKDDAFSTIISAVRHGRVIFGNIRKFVLYLMSGNLSEILVVGLATTLGAPLPILPLQILFLNLVSDVFPALALGMGDGDPGVMQQRPRDPKEPVLAHRHWVWMGGFSLLIAACVLGAFATALYWLRLPQAESVTISFLSLAFARVWHVFNMRNAGSALLRNDVTRNPWVWAAVAVCVALLAAAVYLPGLSTVLKTVPPDTRSWGLVLGASVIPLLVGQIVQSRRRSPRN
jgi:P-type Ca2+ transporter type 2C